jgi:hypothetical protein
LWANGAAFSALALFNHCWQWLSERFCCFFGT